MKIYIFVYQKTLIRTLHTSYLTAKFLTQELLKEI